MLKVSSKERGEAAEKRELAKLKLIKISKEEMKKLNRIVHSKELIKNENGRKDGKKDNTKWVVERNNKTVSNSASSTFYCCATYWPTGIQCFVCNNSCEDIY